MDILSFVGDYTQIGATGLLVIVVLFILTGKLVPLRQLKDAQKAADQWRAAHDRSEDARKELAQENYKLLEGNRISEKFFTQFVPAVDEDTHARRRHAADRESAT